MNPEERAELDAKMEMLAARKAEQEAIRSEWEAKKSSVEFQLASRKATGRFEAITDVIRSSGPTALGALTLALGAFLSYKNGLFESREQRQTAEKLRQDAESIRLQAIQERITAQNEHLMSEQSNLKAQQTLTLIEVNSLGDRKKALQEQFDKDKKELEDKLAEAEAKAKTTIDQLDQEKKKAQQELIDVQQRLERAPIAALVTELLDSNVSNKNQQNPICAALLKQLPSMGTKGIDYLTERLNASSSPSDKAILSFILWASTSPRTSAPRQRILEEVLETPTFSA